MTFFILASAITYGNSSQCIFYGLGNTLQHILKNKRRLIKGDHTVAREQSALPGMPALHRESKGWEEGLQAHLTHCFPSSSPQRTQNRQLSPHAPSQVQIYVFSSTTAMPAVTLHSCSLITFIHWFSQDCLGTSLA